MAAGSPCSLGSDRGCFEGLKPPLLIVTVRPRKRYSREAEMAGQVWLNYAGAIGGFIGSVTGIGGLVLGILAFRRTGQLKALDLRLELRRCERVLRSDADGIVKLLESAKASHSRLSAAQGCYHSGAMQHWLAEWEADLANAKALLEQVNALGETGKPLLQDHLEGRLNAVQDLQHWLDKLACKYTDSLTEDNEGRVQLRADQRAATQARMEGKS